jgi:hypothetical protein
MIPNPFKRPAPHKQPLFAPSTLKLSEKVHWLARRGLIDPLAYVQRHVRGDWGEIDEVCPTARGMPSPRDWGTSTCMPHFQSLEHHHVHSISKPPSSCCED